MLSPDCRACMLCTPDQPPVPNPRDVRPPDRLAQPVRRRRRRMLLRWLQSAAHQHPSWLRLTDARGRPRHRLPDCVYGDTQALKHTWSTLRGRHQLLLWSGLPLTLPLTDGLPLRSGNPPPARCTGQVMSTGPPCCCRWPMTGPRVPWRQPICPTSGGNPSATWHYQPGDTLLVWRAVCGGVSAPVGAASAHPHTGVDD